MVIWGYCMNLIITDHAIHRLKQRHIDIKDIEEYVNRYNYIIKADKNGYKKFKMYTGKGKKVIYVVVKQVSEYEIKLITVINAKREKILG